jgi:hypothetical protein
MTDLSPAIWAPILPIAVLGAETDDSRHGGRPVGGGWAATSGPAGPVLG